MKLAVWPENDRWFWRVADDEGQPVGNGDEATETLAHAAMRQAAKTPWAQGED